MFEGLIEPLPHAEVDALARRRGEAVAAFLTARGVAGHRIELAPPTPRADGDNAFAVALDASPERDPSATANND